VKSQQNRGSEDLLRAVGSFEWLSRRQRISDMNALSNDSTRAGHCQTQETEKTWESRAQLLFSGCGHLAEETEIRDRYRGSFMAMSSRDKGTMERNY
jgi:hypothetical protein